MSIGVLGKKVGMTQVFGEDGRAVPVTVIEAGPCPVVEVRTPEKNSYSAVQLGFIDEKPSHVNKAKKGYFEHQGVTPKKVLREFRVDDASGYSVGQTVTVELFSGGERVDVRGVSKGKGYAGGMKRHHFSGGPASHGASKVHRKPGSSGANSYPGHIFKGKKMAGRMGGERVTAKGLTVFAVDAENNLILIRGSVPGANDGLVLIYKTA
ncbi:MAG: 50S ribosomal protein L3 [Synergistaceae bacterium]|jgi:large subunit ribosomal protein L3|nr:50S ribosomal protein L3 [Synergistaceae bacterium]